MEAVTQALEVAAIWVVVAIVLFYIARWVQVSDSRRTNMQIGAFLWPIALPYSILYFGFLGTVSLLAYLAKKIDHLIWMSRRKAIDRSEFGILWEGRMPYGRHIEVEVHDSTGTYLIPVKPDFAITAEGGIGTKQITTAREAVAWTYGLHRGSDLVETVRA